MGGARGRSDNSLFPWLRHLFADSSYAGPTLAAALAKLSKWTSEIVKRRQNAERLRPLTPPLDHRSHRGLALRGLRYTHSLEEFAGCDNYLRLLVGHMQR
jgi:hypothetical protein